VWTSDAVEDRVSSENGREPEATLLNPSTSKSPPASSLVPLKPAKRSHKPREMMEMEKVIYHCLPLLGFTIEVSVLRAAVMTATVVKQRKDVMIYVAFDPLPEVKKCKMCKTVVRKNYQSLVRHWLEVHAFNDLQTVLKSPAGDHSALTINSKLKVDIMLAALYACPLQGCHSLDRLEARVFVNKETLDRHAKAHHHLQGEHASTKEEAAMIVQQMERQVATYVSNHPFWQEAPQDFATFACRDNTLVWMLNQ